MANLAEFTPDQLDIFRDKPARGFIEDTAVVAQNFACGLYRNYAGWTAGAPDLIGAGAALHGVWQDFCKNAPGGLPVPTPPPPGGQCPARYDIRGTVGAFCPQPEPTPSIVGQNVLGPITGFSVSTSGPRPNPPSACRVYDIQISWVDGNGVAGGANITSQELNGGGQVPFNPQFVRVDGQPDTCGNGPPVFDMRVPDGSALTPAPDVQITPTIRLPQPIVVFKPPSPPSLNFQVGAINVNVNLGGLTLNFNPSINIAPRPNAPTLPTPMPSQEDDTCADYSGRFDSIDEDLDDLKECDRCKPEIDTFTQLFGEAEGRVINLPPKTYSVKLSLVEIPGNAKIEFATDSPDVIYAGWGWFGRDGHVGQRLPIDAQFKEFIVQRDSFEPTQFSYSCRANFTATLEVLYFEENIPDGD